MDRTLQPPVSAGEPKLLDQVRDVCRFRHYSIRTEQGYADWIKRYIFFHGKRHPKDLTAAHVRDFLTHLAVKGKVTASTQNQAFSALLFLYQQVLQQEIGLIEDVERAKTPKRVPVVFTREEARAVLAQLTGTIRLMADLLYGSGLRLMECLRLRVKDIDFGYAQITVRDGKGAKDRVTLLPEKVREPLKRHLIRVKTLHDDDLAGQKADNDKKMRDGTRQRFLDRSRNSAGSRRMTGLRMKDSSEGLKEDGNRSGRPTKRHVDEGRNTIEIPREPRVDH
jgi:integrase